MAGPLIGLVIVCASLGGIVAGYYSDGRDGRQPTRYYDGAVAEVIVPITATRVNLWAEFMTTADEAAATIELNSYLGLSSYFTGTRADGAPWVFQPSDDLRSYVREVGDRVIVGVPVGWSADGGTLASMTEVEPSGYALGFSSAAELNALPLVLILPALGGIILFLRTMSPRRNLAELAAEEERTAQRDEARRARSAASGEMKRRMDRWAQADYERRLAEWNRQNRWFIGRGEHPGTTAPLSPGATEGFGPLAWLIFLMLFAGPLWALALGVATGIRALNTQIAEDSALTLLLPLMGDTPWRVLVMATTVMLVLSLIPALGAMLAWRVNLPRIRTIALVLTGLMLVLMLVFVIAGTTLPLDRGIE